MNEHTKLELKRAGLVEGATITPEVVAAVAKVMIARDEQALPCRQESGGASERRDYFEAGTQFLTKDEDACRMILDGYERASLKAERSASKAIGIGTRELMAVAIWEEAVAETLERVLGCFKRHSDTYGVIERDDALELPKPPEPTE